MRRETSAGDSGIGRYFMASTSGAIVSAPWPTYAVAPGAVSAPAEGAGGSAEGPGVADVTGGTGERSGEPTARRQHRESSGGVGRVSCDFDF